MQRKLKSIEAKKTLIIYCLCCSLNTLDNTSLFSNVLKEQNAYHNLIIDNFPNVLEQIGAHWHTCILLTMPDLFSLITHRV